ncbi:amidohydrolase family protein [Kordiimonas sp. A6E486]|nr:amidohydrolase family protein [Kordiimonas marina]
MFVAFVVMSTAGVGASAADTPEYDIVIRNGRVLDGAGNPWVRADVAIKDGRFAKIGHVTGHGKKEIDAKGLYVSPGWIDMMDQSGSVLLKNGLAENKVRMGVTTAIAGEDGTPVPAAKISAYFDQLERQGISLNFGSYYSATQARVAVMGDGEGQPTDKQLATEEALVAEAMQQGAFGITTALVYPPASFQSTDELIALSRVAAQYGGIYASHIRGEGRYLLPAVKEAITIGQKAGIKVEIYHLKAAYQPKWGIHMHELGKLVNKARADGVDIAADLYPYTAGGTGLEVSVPDWVFKDGYDEGMKRLRDPEIRKRLKREVRAPATKEWSNMVQESGGWSHVVLANSITPKYRKYQFKSIAEIAKELGKDPEDVAWDIMLEALPGRAVALYFMISEDDLQYALKTFPWVSIGSDAAASASEGGIDALGLPHPRSYGTFPRIIAEYVKKQHIISLSEAIRKMTSWPASRMGITDRGVIRKGMWADVVLFNLDTIKDQADWQHPMRYPTGIDYVLVNGVPVVVHGKHTGARPGKTLKGAGYVGKGAAPHPQS